MALNDSNFVMRNLNIPRADVYTCCKIDRSVFSPDIEESVSSTESPQKRFKLDYGEFNS